MDRNADLVNLPGKMSRSLSARRAWIEIQWVWMPVTLPVVALRKESVDRNSCCGAAVIAFLSVALRKESVDRNAVQLGCRSSLNSSRSPQGERG